MDTEPPLSLHHGHLSPSAVLQNERQVVRQAGRQAILQFLDQHACFSVLRASGKVVVFDIRIPIQLAFYALVEHGMLLCVRAGSDLSVALSLWYFVCSTLLLLIIIMVVVVVVVLVLVVSGSLAPISFSFILPRGTALREICPTSLLYIQMSVSDTHRTDFSHLDRRHAGGSPMGFGKVPIRWTLNRYGLYRHSKALQSRREGCVHISNIQHH